LRTPWRIRSAVATAVWGRLVSVTQYMVAATRAAGGPLRRIPNSSSIIRGGTWSER